MPGSRGESLACNLAAAGLGTTRTPHLRVVEDRELVEPEGLCGGLLAVADVFQELKKTLPNSSMDVVPSMAPEALKSMPPGIYS